MSDHPQPEPIRTDPLSGTSVPPDTDPHQRVIVVVGPTAVGKTALAEKLALDAGGEVLSADSMQIYRGMNVGTAKPAPTERQVPYHGIDLVDPGEPFSAALFQRYGRAAIADMGRRGVVPVVAGGTGLYVRAVLDDWQFPAGEQRDNPVRAQYETYEREHGALALHSLLSQRDPASAALIHPNNTRRVIRALEMADEGTSYATQHQGFSARRSVYDARFVGLTMERTALYARIDERVDTMIAHGLVAEVEQLLARGFREALTAQQAIGYKELVPVIEADADLDEAIAQIKQASRRYAKRQLTWFRADPRIHWIDVTDLSLTQTVIAASEALR